MHNISLFPTPKRRNYLIKLKVHDLKKKKKKKTVTKKHGVIGVCTRLYARTWFRDCVNTEIYLIFTYHFVLLLQDFY